MIRKIIVAFCLLIIFGCTTTATVKTDGDGNSAPPPPPPANLPHLSLMGTEFDDVDIPFELKLAEDESIMLNTRNFIGGSLTYAGSVTVDSLIRFFKTQMAKKGWEFAASSYAKKNIILAFAKPLKNCIIYIYGSADSFGNTKVQIWVGNSILKDNPDPQHMHHK
ncbi:MAG: hypothetical protein HQK89_02410 [Nitrospirae bacterium]|nr:hypothetical protein [Nitrospirota bacterium]